MGRLSAVFVGICMVLIAGSIGAILFLRFGLDGMESTIVGLIALIGMAVFNVVARRAPAGTDNSGEVADLANGIADLARQVTELGRRVTAIEGRAQAAVEKTLAATQPISAEIGEAGVLIQHLAETVAAHDTQLKVLAPTSTVAPAAVPPAPAAAGPPPPTPPPLPSASAAPISPAVPPPPPPPPVVEPPAAPIAPLVAALPTETMVPQPAAAAPPPPPPAPPVPPPVPPVAAKPVDPPASAPLAPPSSSAAAAAAPAAPAPPATAAPFATEVPPTTTRVLSGRFKDMEHSAVIELIREAVDSNRIDLFLQPIVTLPQRKVRYYEAVARLRAGDGDPMMAADFLPYAEIGGLMPKIDNLMMFRCVQVVRRLLAKNREIGLFCNLSSTTLVDSQTFSQFTEFMEANKAIAPALVFEFTQSALRAMGPIENESLAALRERGYRFSLDNVTDLRIEPRDLAERGFRFVKVQSGLLLNRTGVTLSDIHPQDFSGLLSRHGIELIAAKIESEAAVVDLLDYDVKFGQGFLFSPPRPVRPEVMQGIGDRNDVVVREPGDTTAPTGEAPPVAPRMSSLAQLARGAGRN
jgi:cyclic-di-GMP phosphodiesterase TipF (flagellum assembly factor)